MSKLQLRDYQETGVRDTIAALDRNPILVSPTGSGKTRTAVAIVERLDRRTLWLSHRRELIQQAASALEQYGLSVGVIQSGHPTSPLARVQVASVQTLVRREMPPAELIIADEAHHATSAGFRTILEAYPGVPRVGLTATPFRLDGRGLGDLFGELVVAAYTAGLVAAGYLHAPKVWASKSPDLRGIRVLAGDYNLSQLSARTNTAELNADIVASWQKHAAGKRTVAFAVDIPHSVAIAQAFRDAGVPAEHLDGKTPADERDAILKRLHTGETLVVSNCMVLTEGWDLPALECAIIARPTASLNLHLQTIGRVMRAAEGKESAIVLDHAGNYHVHGLVTRRLKYSLEPGSRVGFEDPLGLRRCKACGLYFDIAEDACPECGWQAGQGAGDRERPAIHGSGELCPFDDGDFEYRRQVWMLFEAQREAANYREGWAAYRYRDRFGEWPVLAGRELIDPANATMEEKQAVYEQFVAIAKAKGFHPGWAAHQYREAFGCWPRGFVQRVRFKELQEQLMAR